ncbi:hypothetical protein [Mesorhizobium sp. Root157]|uniref:hypothetical protein n=1 Tax=Mesorhizobium sp. Root157 TaxID=1736477 RepID=UPI000AED7BD2|nr:hypothetical protein [Mesorhizobium sp. Root157]
MDQLRRILIEEARSGALVTYRELAERLGLMPPQTILQLTGLLEVLMAEDAAADRPLLAALCVGRLRRNLPAPGFFVTAGMLGLFMGDPEGPEARDFHDRELAGVFSMYRRSHDGRDLIACDGPPAATREKHHE